MIRIKSLGIDRGYGMGFDESNIFLRDNMKGRWMIWIEEISVGDDWLMVFKKFRRVLRSLLENGGLRCGRVKY